jgi:hypothetical protein
VTKFALQAAEESASHELEDAYENDFEDEQYDREAHVTSSMRTLEAVIELMIS